MHLHAKLAVAATAVLGLAPSASRADEKTEKLECPAAVKGVDVSVAPSGDDVALVFKAPEKDQVAGLRKILREAGAVIEYHSKMAALHPELERPEFADKAIPPVDVVVTDAPTGAKVTIRAEKRSDHKNMVAQAKKFEESWENSTCVRERTATQEPIATPATDRM